MNPLAATAMETRMTKKREGSHGQSAARDIEFSTCTYVLRK